MEAKVCRVGLRTNTKKLVEKSSSKERQRKNIYRGEKRERKRK
jgi:hypothetical protein